jgi:nucleotide exchange factor SIL1
MLQILSLPLSLLFLLAPTITSASAPSSPSPPASTSLICHTTDPRDCYPRIFQPTTEFQIVHDDQSLPPGLHIRLNWATGQKEAKINEDLPINEAELAIAVEGDDGDDDGGVIKVPGVGRQAPLLAGNSPGAPPPYSAAGKIPIPKDRTEHELFATGIEILNSINHDDNAATLPPTLLSALETLEDLSHDLYYGQEIARNSTTLRNLFSLLLPPTNTTIRAAASLVLGSSFQNNPTALSLALTSNNALLITNLLSALTPNTPHPKVQERILYALSATTRAPGQRAVFLKHNGMYLLQTAFASPTIGREDDDSRDGVRGKIANFIKDNFLDELMMTGDVGDEDGSFAQNGHRKLGKEEEEILRPWCRVFGGSLKRWVELGVRGGSYERVDGAYMALIERLGECSDYL